MIVIVGLSLSTINCSCKPVCAQDSTDPACKGDQGDSCTVTNTSTTAEKTNITITCGSKETNLEIPHGKKGENGQNGTCTASNCQKGESCTVSETSNSGSKTLTFKCGNNTTGSATIPPPVKVMYLGYAYKAWKAGTANTKITPNTPPSPTPRSIDYIKKENTSLLKITYYDHFSVYPSEASKRTAGSAGANAEIFIDGKPCTNPTAMKAFIYNTDSGKVGSNTLRPHTLTGICDGLTKGKHTVQVYVTKAPGFADGEITMELAQNNSYIIVEELAK